jgi:hypothetical protein
LAVMEEHQIAAYPGWIEIGNRAADIDLGSWTIPR